MGGFNCKFHAKFRWVANEISKRNLGWLPTKDVPGANCQAEQRRLRGLAAMHDYNHLNELWGRRGRFTADGINALVEGLKASSVTSLKCACTATAKLCPTVV